MIENKLREKVIIKDSIKEILNWESDFYHRNGYYPASKVFMRKLATIAIKKAQEDEKQKWIKDHNEEQLRLEQIILNKDNRIAKLEVENVKLDDRIYLMEQAYTKLELDSEKAREAERERVLDEIEKLNKEFNIGECLLCGGVCDKRYYEKLNKLRSTAKKEKT